MPMSRQRGAGAAREAFGRGWQAQLLRGFNFQMRAGLPSCGDAPAWLHCGAPALTGLGGLSLLECFRPFFSFSNAR